MGDAYEINLTSPPISPRHLKTNTNAVKKFVDLFKNTIKNRIYKKSRKVKVLTSKPCYLRINDKKETETAEGQPSYDFIDVLGANMKEDDI